jgi:hypothetical protein
MKTKSSVMQLLLIGLVMLIPTKNFAQAAGTSTSEQKKEKIESQKVAFITEKLDLTPDEAQKFWPVYNEYDAQKELLNKAFRQKVKAYKSSTPTETGADSLLLAEIEHDQALLDLKKVYISKFKTVISSEKLIQLNEAERDFKKMLLKLIREQKKAEIKK